MLVVGVRSAEASQCNGLAISSVTDVCHWWEFVPREKTGSEGRVELQDNALNQDEGLIFARVAAMFWGSSLSLQR